jgi:hypothetical protein
MRERLRVRQSNNLVGYAALVVAIFAALGGVAVGLPGKNKVTANDLKTGAVTTRAIRAGAVGRGKLGVTARPIWATVEADGTIIAQKGGAFVSHTPGTGLYYISWGKDLSKRAATATAQLQTGNGISIIAVPCAGTPVNPSCPVGFDDKQHLLVGIRGGPGSVGPGDLVDEPFSVTVLP